ncbi:unnamed protein product [Lathyrus oleraceus]
MIRDVFKDYDMENQKNVFINKSGITCFHVIACIWNIKKQPEDYVAARYRKPTFMDTYSNIVYPTNGPKLWPIDDLNTMAPPVMRRAIGRPKNRETRQMMNLEIHTYYQRDF